MNVLAQQLPGFGRERPGPCPQCAGLGTIEATDMFCGAGGSALGLEHVCCPACGRPLIVVTQALNHWALAVEAHNANFPNADHDVHDVQDIPPARFRRTQILWASPECVYYTSCRGKQEDSDEAVRSRATFKDVVRFTDYHRYDAVIVENVVEARLWCEHEGCRCGAEFDAWFAAMCELGYEGQIVYFNSQFALPTPQSRDRMYVVFWRVGLPVPELALSPSSWCTSCATIVRGVRQWKKASRGSIRDTIFEWGRYGSQYVYTCPNEGCGQPVAPAVVGARSIIDRSLPIERIADKTPVYCKTCHKRHPVACNTRKRIRVGAERVGARRPMQVQVGGHLYERDGYARVWSLDAPARTVTGSQSMAVADFDGMVLRCGGQSHATREAGEPMTTITAHDRQIGFVTPDNRDALLLQNMQNNVGRDVGEPAPPVTTRGNHLLVQVNRGGNKGGRRSWELDEPHPTVAGHGEVGLVEFRGAHGSVRSADEPAHTVTAEGTHHGLLVYNGVPGFVRDLGDAAGTVTGRDKQSLLVPYFRTGVARALEEPTGTVTSHDREALVLTDEDIDECYLRMLKWPELLRAQMMHEHADGTPYELTARRRNSRGKMVELSDELRTKMIGNAVSAPVATLLGRAVVEILE